MPAKKIYRNQKVSDTLPKLKQRYDTRQKYDWMTIRTEFIEGVKDADGTIVYPAYKDLAELHSVPYEQVSNRAAHEHWKDHKEAHQREIAVARQKEAVKMLSKKAVKFDEQSAEAAYKAQMVVLTRLDQIISLQQVDTPRISALKTMIENGEAEVDGQLRAELKPLVSSSELESLLKALALAREVGQKALGIPDNEPAIRQQVNIETVVTNNVVNQLRNGDESRNAALLSVLGNPNLRLPGIRDAEPSEAVVEAELLEITDGDD